MVDLRQISVSFEAIRFVESEPPPGDARQVGMTWLYANKDGSPDKRFRDNLKLPIVEYGQLDIRSSTGLHERDLISNVAAGDAFAHAFRDLIEHTQALSRHESDGVE